jgi:hypothetical protein
MYLSPIYVCSITPNAGAPLSPMEPINIKGLGGFYLRNDDLTTFANVRNGTGLTDPEIYYAYSATSPTSLLPIPAGAATVLSNKQTGMFCRLSRLPTSYPFADGPGGGVTPLRRLASVPSTCVLEGVLADQPSVATATVFTYTGKPPGMSAPCAAPIHCVGVPRTPLDSYSKSSAR